MCRGCMRETHKHNPFHRIQRWTGSYFRSADLWEVGTYLLVPHHCGNSLCDNLTRHRIYFEAVEKGKDKSEQENLNMTGSAPAPAPATCSGPCQQTDLSPFTSLWGSDSNTASLSPTGMEPATASASASPPTTIENDENFIRYLQSLHEDNEVFDDADDTFESDDDVEVEETEDPNINRYLPTDFTHGAGESSGYAPTYSSDLPFIGSYIRVVHCNGIHNIAMVTCDCRGQNDIPEDLLAAGLMPTSFQRIRTLFTIQLLDLFRLSNLELKASAYQFYQLIRRLTAPMDPAGVVDLYREFRRMSRLWRWMKRLKWAGRGSNDRPAKDVNPGELVIFCPACPQPGINIPANWKDDPNRHDLLHVIQSIRY